ncbi:MAG: TetR/AcrR family transcriptional regulator [Clostridiaceae bacterium]|nr:TetR/AcrR family transcriptional regulator [Clostridiaceae bacterium]
MVIVDKKELVRIHAIDVIARKGFQNTKVKDIAKECQIASGTIYNYFKSKNEIMEYIIITEFEKRTMALKRALEKNNTFVFVIDAILEYHIEEIRENPALVKLIMQETFQLMEHSNVTIINILNENDKLMTEFIVQAQQTGEISKNFDAGFIAASILYSFRNFAYAYIKKNIPNLGLVETKKQILQFYINGLN